MNTKARNNLYTKLAFNQAEINLGSTAKNPSVGCVIVKNNSVISSSCTSLNGRPHAESQALNKKINFKKAKMYVTLEPCSHYGLTPPCTKKIISKKIDKVFYSIEDVDPRSKSLAKKKLKKSKVNVQKNILKTYANYFYKSYFNQITKKLPLVDAKIALSKDYFTINKKNKWITNKNSRKVTHLLRSKYNCIVSSSQTLNEDNSMLNCRIEGLEKKSPDVVILDRYFKIKKNLNIFKNKQFRKIYLVTKVKNLAKEKFFKNLGVFIITTSSHNKQLEELFFILKNKGFHRILVESGVTLLNEMLKNKLINNLYVFKSSDNLKSLGYNRSSIDLIKSFRLIKKNRIEINLKNDNLYKIKIKNV